MIRANEFVKWCREFEFTFCSGTPCSYLSPLMNQVIDAEGMDYFPAVNEGDAVATACGAALAGRRSMVMFQNSGLGNAVNVLSSLVHPYRFPMLVVISLRGEVGSGQIEPQHELMGNCTLSMLECLQLHWEWIPRDEKALPELFQRIDAHCRTIQQPFVLVMRNGDVAPFKLPEVNTRKKSDTNALIHRDLRHDQPGSRPIRTEALAAVLRYKQKQDLIVCTTGKSSRELYTLADAPEHLYMVGSMGCASSLGLGLALNKPDHRVMVIDGDGALLMRMGNLATSGIFSPSNFFHLLLDNEAHDSTGGQPTFSGGVDFARIAQACGYREIFDLDHVEGLKKTLAKCKGLRGPIFLRMRIRKGSPKILGRPQVSPENMKIRIMTHIGTTSPQNIPVQ